MCRWAAARPRDRHTRACGSEWSISRPALALPPPTGTAARPSRPRGGLQSVGVPVCCPAGVPGAGVPGRPRDRHTRAFGSEWSISKPARALRTLRSPPHQWRLVCAWVRRLGVRPGLTTAHGCRSQAQVLWVAHGSARQAVRSSETAIAFACACMREIETAITFAGEKRAFLVQFLGAKVMAVSMVTVRGRALVLWVSKSRVGVHCMRLFAPCSAKSAREREKVRPACSKEPKIGVLWRAGRVFSRNCRWWGCVGVRQRGGIP